MPNPILQQALPGDNASVTSVFLPLRFLQIIEHIKTQENNKLDRPEHRNGRVSINNLVDCELDLKLGAGLWTTYSSIGTLAAPIGEACEKTLLKGNQVKDLGCTRNCNWRVSNHHIHWDPPGRKATA